jgi:hypothetical protein
MLAAGMNTSAPKDAARVIAPDMEPSPKAPSTGAGRQPLSPHLTGGISTRAGRPPAEAAVIPRPAGRVNPPHRLRVP